MKRTVVLSSPGIHVALRDGCLAIAMGSTEVARVPIEDLGVLILDGPGATVTSSVLDAVVSSGAVLVACGSDHMPSGILHSIAGNSLHTERIRHQVESSSPLRKNLWARIVRAKLKAQAAATPSARSREILLRLASSVRSGDYKNIEALAARAYWSTFFLDCQSEEIAQPFHRHRGGPPPNNLLNYGYTALRAAVARALCATGLHPALGIHHHNRYDSFALASDVMEPFRPWVDLRVRHAVKNAQVSLTKDAKAHLLEVLTDHADCGGAEGPLLVAIDRTCASLAECYSLADRGLSAPEVAQCLTLPSLPMGSRNHNNGEDDSEE